MITHDICQPWEVELARLKKRLKEAEEVIYLITGPVEFYCEVGEASKQAVAKSYIKKYGNKDEQASYSSK